MRLSCSGVLFPLSIRGRTALLLAIVPTPRFESPSRGTAFVPFVRSSVFHQLSRHQLRCYLSPLSYLSAVIKYLKLHLPSKCSVRSKIFSSWRRGKDLEENFLFFFSLQRKCNYLWYIRV